MSCGRSTGCTAESAWNLQSYLLPCVQLESLKPTGETENVSKNVEFKTFAGLSAILN